MKRSIIIGIIAILAGQAAWSQKYITKNGYIRFHSETPIETIEAHNRQVNCALDAATGDLVFQVLMKSFEFEKALMQEHFNENYVESDKYPNATFKGRIVDFSNLELSEGGEHEVKVEGDLTIHGVTRKISETGTLSMDDGKLYAKSKFQVKPADYDIKIPRAVVNNIAESIDVYVDMKMEKHSM